MIGDPAVLQALYDAVAELQSTQNAIAALSNRDDGQWRRELVGYRRQLQQRVQNVASLLEQVHLADDDMRQLRAALGRMRSLVALHQANWPAVAIDRDSASYQSSIVNVRSANRDFVNLVAKFLPRPRQP